ncbi:MAG TPA: 16S rRNA (uracil(1498)-N(3))-methyltransferase [Nitrospinota bacterium]|nr:16S rRNA (uracil(1498)-N(3))-methyltransferase [Nitrospinota bacterium]
MHRFFIKPENIKRNTITLSNEDVTRIRRVLRCKKGDCIKVLDGKGGEYLVQIEKIDPNIVKGRILERTFIKNIPDVSVVMGQGIPKGSKMDLIVQKATELGVDKIIPLITERTVVKINNQSSYKKIERWRRIAKGSSEQSCRSFVPEISHVMDLYHFFSKYRDADTKLILWEEEKNIRFRDRLRNIDKIKELILVIGPEGGFSKKEIKRAEDEGFVSVGLGFSILRTETAPLVTLSVIQYILGNLG